MVRRALVPGARHLNQLTGVNQKCDFLELQENVLARLGDILVGSNRIFRLHADIVMEVGSGDRRSLVTLASGRKIERIAVPMLANLAVCQLESDDGNKFVQFPLPERLVAITLNHEPTLARLPTIETYARRPLFNLEFLYLGPGYHAGPKYLVHAPDIDPIIPEAGIAGGSIRDRLPPRLRELLAEFCFRSDNDLVNALAALLTGVLANLFVSQGKAVFVIDGNQPSLGKTLLAMVLGVLLDNRVPSPIEYSADEAEIRKKVGATLMGSRPSVILIDNCKPRGGRIESAYLEGVSTSPVIAERILGRSANHEQPNDVLWVLTMNNTILGADMTARSCPIRLYYEGDPSTRTLSHRDLVGYVRQHRHELLAELAGMVVRWSQQGRTPGTAGHRLDNWARTIGGILDANGLPGFLRNLDEANADFNADSDDLCSLAHSALRLDSLQSGAPLLVRVVDVVELEVTTEPAQDIGRSARELESLFRSTGILVEKLNQCKSPRGRSTVIGNYLSRLINRSTTVVEHIPEERQGTAVLRTATRSHGNQKVYFFNVRWDDPPEVGTECPPPETNDLPAQMPATETTPPPPGSGANQVNW